MMTEATRLAEIFHAAYESLAPKFRYETRVETRQFDRNSPNGKLMIAVCAVVLDRIRELEAAHDE